MRTHASGFATLAELALLADGADEGLLHRVLGVGQVAADRVELHHEAAVRRVVQLVELGVAAHAFLLDQFPTVRRATVVVEDTNPEGHVRFPR